MGKPTFTQAAWCNINEFGVDVSADLAAMRDGACNAASLLDFCLSGSDEAHAQGWRDYVNALSREARR